MKRNILALAIIVATASTASAQISNDVVRIGVLTDLSSWGRDNSGPGSVEAAKMAVEEFGPTVLGKPIEIVSADHQMKTDVGLQIVRDWFDNGKVDAVADIPNSGIAIAVHNMVRERNKIALLSGPGASSLTDELCSPNTVHFSYDTYALSKVTASAVIKEGGKSWFFVTADYAFGQQLEKDATRFIKELDGEVLGNVRHPTNTADFSSFVLQAQNSKADVVAFANAGQDTDNAIKQSGEFGLVQAGQKLVGLLMFDTDVHAVGLQAAQGTYMTTASYWNMDDKTRAWSKRFFARTNVMPTMIHTGVYGSVLHYLKAIKAAGTDDPAAVMAKMRELPVEDTFVHGARLREDGRVIRDMYLARVKKPSDSKEPWDYLEIVKTIRGEDAYRPVSESKCALLKK
ncbi:branched-chain amino acid transport system substrate-binding protein [Bradyrhizobium sp. USDA 4524]|uniref:ABC transporter substrate-binding protein n=1 Tax=unclassified Bradyrhizobium TaxID=2631580 RepID=UPI00209E12E0|nr:MULTISPECIES: ABC transporter substrate-binding protein [unclassified Bradyrhizobium]MCP1845422.1 branched-chain amino acid transport system substrate-binding protein [Bradyrhizobium sp. USDA 4538]MCP1905986.1 branched-chain amino acid transport system substrate-binding protein [Bradyrhizobium sp. USDA 4537]MCP1988359.1 branched-chain amino acid transport system substrate-binding protein [Bradyrhizobium sp. USDA 4539]